MTTQEIYLVECLAEICREEGLVIAEEEWQEDWGKALRAAIKVANDRRDAAHEEIMHSVETICYDEAFPIPPSEWQEDWEKALRKAIDLARRVKLVDPTLGDDVWHRTVPAQVSGRPKLVVHDDTEKWQAEVNLVMDMHPDDFRLLYLSRKDGLRVMFVPVRQPLL